MSSLDGSFDSYNNGMIEVLLLGDSLISTYGEAIRYDKGINLGSTYVKVLDTKLGHLDGIALRINIGTELRSIDGFFDVSNDGKLENLLLVESLGSSGGKVLSSDEDIKLGLYGGKIIGTIIKNVDGITLWIDVGTELCSLDGSFDVSNDGKLQVLMLVGSLGFIDSKIFGSDEGIKLGLSVGRVLDNILVNAYGIILGLDVGT